jgi:hypothetical protein
MKDERKEARRKLYRALLGARPAVPGLSRGVGMGKHEVGLGEGLPVAKGKVTITCRNEETGEVVTVLEEEDNLVVSQAGGLMAAMAAGALNSEIGYVELGDPAPATPPALGDVTLEQTTGQRKAVGYSLASNVVTFTATWAAGDGNGNTYTEAGLFTNPLAAGTMFARKTGFSIAKTAAFSMTFTWALTFSVLDACEESCYGVSLVGSSYVVEDYIYDATGGESQVVVPIDFTVGSKRLEVFLNGQRLYYQRHYIEQVIGLNKGVVFQGGMTLEGAPDPDDMYFRHLRW